MSTDPPPEPAGTGVPDDAAKTPPEAWEAASAAEGGVYETTLGEAFDHPTLCQEYPHLRGVPVAMHAGVARITGDDFAAGYAHRPCPYAPKGRIEVAGLDEADMQSILLHEIQHLVQEFEGFAPGADPRSAEARKRATEEMRRDTATARADRAAIPAAKPTARSGPTPSPHGRTPTPRGWIACGPLACRSSAP